MTAPSRRSTFRGPVQHVRLRGASGARLKAIVSQDAAAVNSALDQLTEGHGPDRAKAILRRMAKTCADRLGLTIETSTLYASVATDASLVATKAEALFKTEQGDA